MYIINIILYNWLFFLVKTSHHITSREIQGGLALLWLYSSSPELALRNPLKSQLQSINQGDPAYPTQLSHSLLCLRDIRMILSSGFHFT